MCKSNEVRVNSHNLATLVDASMRLDPVIRNAQGGTPQDVAQLFALSIVLKQAVSALLVTMQQAKFFIIHPSIMDLPVTKLNHWPPRVRNNIARLADLAANGESSRFIKLLRGDKQRLQHIIKRGPIKTCSDLERFGPQDFEAFKNFGPHSVTEMVALLMSEQPKPQKRKKRQAH